MAQILVCEKPKGRKQRSVIKQFVYDLATKMGGSVEPEEVMLDGMKIRNMYPDSSLDKPYFRNYAQHMNGEVVMAYKVEVPDQFASMFIERIKRDLRPQLGVHDVGHGVQDNGVYVSNDVQQGAKDMATFFQAPRLEIDHFPGDKKQQMEQMNQLIYGILRPVAQQFGGHIRSVGSGTSGMALADNPIDLDYTVFLPDRVTQGTPTDWKEVSDAFQQALEQHLPKDMPIQWNKIFPDRVGPEFPEAKKYWMIAVDLRGLGKADIALYPTRLGQFKMSSSHQLMFNKKPEIDQLRARKQASAPIPEPEQGDPEYDAKYAEYMRRKNAYRDEKENIRNLVRQQWPNPPKTVATENKFLGFRKWLELRG